MAVAVFLLMRPSTPEPDEVAPPVNAPVAIAEPVEAYTGPSGDAFLEDHGHPDYDAVHDLKLIGRVMDGVTRIFKHLDTRNVATNEQFSAYLTGDNPERLEYLNPELPVFKNGILTDRWGQAYIIHPLGTGLLEIRTIGADGIPYTDDDLRLHPNYGIQGNQSDPNQLPAWDQP
ncbi:MAG: hypothetical protein AAFX93_16410 [Verrucomicrobiota bacterium]